MNDVGAVARIARRHLAPVLDRSGNILYSGATTLRPGSIYLLGLNPGGDPHHHRRQTLRRVLRNLPSKHDNEYLDKTWDGQRTKGTSVLQRRVQWLAKKLGHDLRKTCASNLIFVRSTDAQNCGYPELARLCWPVHQTILSIVRPRLVIAFGNSSISPYAFLRSVLGDDSRERTFPAGHANWRCRAFRAANGMWVVGLPHLSRYAVNRHAEVAKWLRPMASA